jgi:hypothetical protein
MRVELAAAVDAEGGHNEAILLLGLLEMISNLDDELITVGQLVVDSRYACDTVSVGRHGGEGGDNKV